MKRSPSLRSFIASPVRRTQMLHASFGAFAALSALALFAPKARADEKATCVGSYERSQVLRHKGELKKAREEMRVCSRAVCPALVRNDCMSWLEQVDATYPSIVIRAERDGAEIASVRVTIDGDVKATRLDGKSLELDPGEHALKFETDGETAITMPLLIREGEKNRVIPVRFGAAKPASEGGAKDSAATTSTVRPVPTGVYVFGALGVVGIASFAVLGAVGRGDESSLKNTGCSPNCAQADIDSVRTKYHMADISLGVGVASLGVAAVWYALRPTKEATPAMTGLTVAPSSRGTMVGWQGTF